MAHFVIWKSLHWCWMDRLLRPHHFHLSNYRSIAKKLTVCLMGIVFSAKFRNWSRSGLNEAGGACILTGLRGKYVLTCSWAGLSIRITGQDSGRGLRSHIDMLWFHSQKMADFSLLKTLSEDRLRWSVWILPFEEESGDWHWIMLCKGTCLRFVIWEAQFGDFATVTGCNLINLSPAVRIKWVGLCGIDCCCHTYWRSRPEHSQHDFRALSWSFCCWI